jgi:hypothetical protein
MANTPAGKSFYVSVPSASSTATTVVSDVPVNAWEFLNNGSAPIQVRFYVNTSTGVAVFPVAGTPQYDITLQHGALNNQTVYLPARLVSSCSDLGGSTSSIVVSAISQTGTQSLLVTPVQVPNKGN